MKTETKFDSSEDHFNVDNKEFNILSVFKNSVIVIMYIK